MNCEQIEPWISAYQDGELQGRRRVVVEAHLECCAACRELVAEWEALERTLCVELTREEAPEMLHSRVMRCIPEPDRLARIGPAAGWRPGGWSLFSLVPFGAAVAWVLLTARPVPVLPPTPYAQMGQVPPPDPAGNSNISTPLQPAPDRATKEHPPVASPTKSYPPKASPRSRPAAERVRVRRRREPDPLGELRQHRHHRKYYPIARRSHPHDTLMVKAPESAPQSGTDLGSVEGPRKVLAARIRVVDYVLPEVRPEAMGSDAQTEFVLRPAEPIQVSQAAFEY
jgi:hypothetical protein